MREEWKEGKLIKLCDHPHDLRCEIPREKMWKCGVCKCFFWGKVVDTPLKDIYGRTKFEV